jgi:hypothetical protein
VSAARVWKGARFTVIYRSRPAFEIVAAGVAAGQAMALDADPLHEAGPGRFLERGGR